MNATLAAAPVQKDTERQLGQSVRKNDWRTIPLFTAITLISAVGAPWYIYAHGLPWPVVSLFAFYMVATGFSITVGYHRLFSHRTYKAHPIVRFFLLFFGAAAMEESALRWSSQHREHHSFVDTDRDPYNIKKGFFYAHLGWMIFWDHVISYDNVKDLESQKLVMHQHKHYALWAIFSGVVLPLMIGAVTGHVLGALIFSVCLRLVLVYNCTFFINSICHMFGYSTYDKDASAKDNWFIAFLTYGEGYHNFHHRFPKDYRNGVKWYHWDPSKWMIYGFKMLGLAYDLRTVSNDSIEAAKA